MLAICSGIVIFSIIDEIRFQCLGIDYAICWAISPMTDDLSKLSVCEARLEIC